MRYFVCSMFLIVGALALWKKLGPYMLQYFLTGISGIALIIFLIQQIFIFTLTGDSSYSTHYMAHLILLQVYMFSFSTLLFPYAFGVCSLFWFTTFIPLAFGMDVSITLTLSFLLAGVTVVMAIVSYTMETFIRKRFLLMQNVEQERVKIETEKRISQGLLLNIFPKVIIEKFKRDKATIVEEFSDVTIFFSDIVSFTTHSSSQPPAQLVTLLNDMFSRFDEIVGKYKLEKIKTIGKHQLFTHVLR